MRTYSTHYHTDNLARSILGEWLLERETWPTVITPKKTSQLLQSAARVTLLERTSTVSECQFMPPFILNSVTECITWGPPDTSTLHWWNETGAELHLQASARQCGISVEAARGQRNPGRSPIFAQADRQRTGPHCGGVKVVLFRQVYSFLWMHSSSVWTQVDQLLSRKTHLGAIVYNLIQNIIISKTSNTVYLQRITQTLRYRKMTRNRLFL